MATSPEHRHLKYKDRSSLIIASALVVFFAGVFVFARDYVVDWIYIDDLFIVNWLSLIRRGQFGLADLLNSWNNQHPIGSQIVFAYLVDAISGGNSRAIIYANFMVIGLSGTLAGLFVARDAQQIWLRLLALITCLALVFHFSQMDHLLWAFEMGWFVINACFILNAIIIETRHQTSFCPVLVVCLLATFSSAQGAFTWLTAALHYLLRGGSRFAWASFAFLICGCLAILRIVAHGNGNVQTPTSISEAPAFAKYLVQLFGTAFGQLESGRLFNGGALILFLSAFVAIAAKSGRAVTRRIGYVLVFATILSMVSFAHGRFHLGILWATYSFHAAPLLVPLYLGLVHLALSVLTKRRQTYISTVLAYCTLTVLWAGFFTSLAYGRMSARLKVMDQGYAKWVTCQTDLPVTFKARASALGAYSDLFASTLPELKKMCATGESALAYKLTRVPQQYLKMAKAGDDVRTALMAIWQSYAIDPGFQRVFQVDDPDTPIHLIQWFQADAAQGSIYDSARFKTLRETILSLKPQTDF